MNYREEEPASHQPISLPDLWLMIDSLAALWGAWVYTISASSVPWLELDGLAHRLSSPLASPLTRGETSSSKRRCLGPACSRPLARSCAPESRALCPSRASSGFGPGVFSPRHCDTGRAPPLPRTPTSNGHCPSSPHSCRAFSRRTVSCSSQGERRTRTPARDQSA